MLGWVWAAGGLVVLAESGVAQSVSDQVARLALDQTPVSSFAPIATRSILSEVQRRVGVALRYGYLAGQNIEKHNFGATAVIPISIGASASFTGGVSSCIGCGTGLMLGVGADWRFWEFPFASGRDSHRVTVGINGDLGFGQTRGPLLAGGSAWTAAAGLPVAIVQDSRSSDVWRFVPFVTPNVGFGRLNDQAISVHGGIAMLTGGVAMYKRSSRFAVNVGAQYLAARDGDILVGVNVVFGGR